MDSINENITVSGKKRFNIGLAVADITEPFSRRVAGGAMKAAEKLDANLFIFPGGYVGLNVYEERFPEKKYEYQPNALFAHAAAGKFDYMIIAAGTVANSLSDIERRKMFAHFKDMPLLSISARVEGVDFIMYDNRAGIVQAVDHLVKEQGKRHIAMMMGNINNFECTERYKAYREALEKNGIEYNDGYCIYCDLSGEATNEAEQLIVLNPEVDAIICVNDIIAASLYEVLHKHKKHIGVDIAVVGFDDLPFADKLEPPLASVRANAYDLGYAAVEKAVNVLNGVTDDKHYIPTEFIPRQSCCGQSEASSASDKVMNAVRDEIPEGFAAYFTGSREVTGVYAQLSAFAAGLIKELEERFIGRKAAEEDLRYVVKMVDMFFNKDLDTVNNVTKIQNIIDSGFKRLKKEIPAENAELAERLYTYFHKRLAQDIAADYHQLEERHKGRIHNDNLFIRDSMTLGGNLQESYALMLRRLALIGSDTSFLYVFKEPVPYHKGEIFPEDIDWYFMSYVYGEDTFVVPKEDQKMKTPRIFDNKYLDADRRHTLTAVDLFSGENQYGVLLCEPNSQNLFDELQLISYHMSFIVKMLYFRSKEEKSLTDVRVKRSAPKDASRIDDLTGLSNPQGFYEEAGARVSRARNSGLTYIVCCADMNDLTMVNERYGREEGDFSIKSLAGCLKLIFGKTAVVGRLSGDEFAVIVPKRDSGGISEIQKRRKEIIQTLNSDSGKPYLITMSLEMIECECSDSYSLKESVDKAHAKLYEAKKKRRRL